MKFAVLLILTVIILLQPRTASAKSCPEEQKFNFKSGVCEQIRLPENAVFNREKSDWDCRVGFKKNLSQNICSKVKIPSHGKLNYSGDDFICERGYRKLDTECVVIVLPENAVLDSSGHDWKCIAAYKREGDICTKVTLPENAIFFNQGFDWYCNNQFKKENSLCRKFNIPANARLTYTGNDWQCNKGYLKNIEKQNCDPVFVPRFAQVTSNGTFVCDPGYDKKDGECRKVDSILNGKFLEQGIQFYCLNGYKRNEELRTCEKIDIPENAKFDSASIDGWNCLGGYIKQGNTCQKFETEHIIWSGSTWNCKPGYKKDYGSQNCQKVSLPENASYAENTDGWTCNTGYTKNHREKRCDKNPD